MDRGGDMADQHGAEGTRHPRTKSAFGLELPAWSSVALKSSESNKRQI